MIKFDYNGNSFEGRNEWGDITLEKYIELVRIPIPEKLKAYYIAIGRLDDSPEAAKAYEDAFNAITHADWIKGFPTFYGQVIECLSDVPVENIHHETRTEIYDKFFRHFVMTACYDIPVHQVEGKIREYEGEDITTFELDGETYNFPKSLRVMGELVPMYDEPAASFCESADIELSMKGLADEGVEKFATIMAIYCRKDGEVYDESVAVARAELFLKTPMNVVWSLFFCIERLMLQYSLSMELSFEAVRAMVSERLTTGSEA